MRRTHRFQEEDPFRYLHILKSFLYFYYNNGFLCGNGIIVADFNIFVMSLLFCPIVSTFLGEDPTPDLKSVDVPKHFTFGRVGVNLCKRPEICLVSGI